LRQRIAIIHNLEPLQEIETEQYVTHRLKIAGSDKQIFSPEAVREIYSFSKGNPRLINIICDLALLTGYAKDEKTIEPEIIRECAENYLIQKQQIEGAAEDQNAPAKTIPENGIEIPPGASGNSYQMDALKVPKKPAGLKFAYVTPMIVVILLSIFGYLYFFGENHAPYRNLKTYLGQAFDRYTGSKSETSSQNPDETSIQQSNIAGAQVQALDLKTQNTDSENQLAQLKSPNEELRAALEELKGAKERVEELERVVPMLDTMLSQSQQKVAKLAKELNKEKQSGKLLSSELSIKADLVAELQPKLVAILSSQAELENEIGKSKSENEALQGQLLDLKTQKASSDTQLGQMKSQNEALTADLAELKGAKERVAALEGELATKDQSLSGSEQRLSQLAKQLDQEKTRGELLSSELSTKVDLIAELQEKLGNAQSKVLEVEAKIENRTIKINELQEQLENSNAEKASTEAQLAQLRSQNEALTADLAELKGAQERVAVLEGELVAKSQTLSQSAQKVTDLTNALDRERQAKSSSGPSFQRRRI